MKSFTLKSTAGDGDCFFHAVGKVAFTREALVQKLLDNPTEAVRQAFAHEIRQFLYGKTSMGWFFGLKLHLVINDTGELMAFKLTKGDRHDSKTAVALLSVFKGLGFGDKA